MVGVLQVFRWGKPHQPLFHFPDGLAGGNAGPVGQAEDVGIDGDDRLAESGVEDYVGSLAAHARQRLKRLALARHLPLVSLEKHPAAGHQVGGLGVVKPDAADVLADARFAQRQHGMRRVGFGE